MKDSEIRQKLQKGWVHAIVTFEVAGKPKEHVEKSLDEYVKNLKKDERIIFLDEEREEAIEHEDGIFSAFSEAELLVDKLETFTWLCMNFSPSSIEILEPDNMDVTSRDLTNWLNDLLSKIHEVAQELRGTKGSQKHMVVAMNQLIKNSIRLTLEQTPKTEEEISKSTGILGEQLKEFLTYLVEKGEVVEVDGKYQIA